jgi:hypothetical protein
MCRARLLSSVIFTESILWSLAIQKEKHARNFYEWVWIVRDYTMSRAKITNERVHFRSNYSIVIKENGRFSVFWFIYLLVIPNILSDFKHCLFFSFFWALVIKGVSDSQYRWIYFFEHCGFGKWVWGDKKVLSS